MISELTNTPSTNGKTQFTGTKRLGGQSSTGLGIPASSDPQSRSAKAAAGGTLGSAALPLQLPQTSSRPEIWTRSRSLAMQAGLTNRRLTFRDIFTTKSKERLWLK